MKKSTVIKTAGAALITIAMAAGTTVYAEEASYTIGIEQFAEHGSLDNCR